MNVGWVPSGWICAFILPCKTSIVDLCSEDVVLNGRLVWLDGGVFEASERHFWRGGVRVWIIQFGDLKVFCCGRYKVLPIYASLWECCILKGTQLLAAP